MNNTLIATDDDARENTESMGVLGYGIGLSFGIPILILFFIFISYMCNRHRHRRLPTTTAAIDNDDDDDDEGSVTAGPQGLDEATIHAYPKLLYSQAKPHKDDLVTSACPICLADYKDSDMLRLLPDCGHLFHVKCIDPWLRIHPTCPICRSSSNPSPLATHAIDMVPQPS